MSGREKNYPLIGKDTEAGGEWSSDTALLCAAAETSSPSCRPWRLWQRTLLWLSGSRKSSLKRWTTVVVTLILIISGYLLLTSPRSILQPVPPESVFRCSNTKSTVPSEHKRSPEGVAVTTQLRIDPKVLLFTETQHSRRGRAIAELLVANKIKYKIEVIGKSLPLLTNLSKGKYGAVVFENFERYLVMDTWNRELLDKYLVEYNVGMVGFLPPHEETVVGAKIKGFPLYVHTNMALENVTLNAENPVLRLTRSGDTLWGEAPGTDWTIFSTNHSTYEALELAVPRVPHYTKEKLITAVLDKGKYDGICRVLFGYDLKFWLHNLLFLDAISYLSRGKLSLSLDRYILVDIDDIFVGHKGTRMTVEDVEALLAAQKRLRDLVPGWRFNLGFSGKYFKSGYPDENLGDEALLQNVEHFWWFGHMWGHTQPHKFNSTEALESVMQMNKQFAKTYGIPTDSGYSVAPHHSGVYPVHEQLYDAWKKVWNIRVTSTEEYPHLRPARLRRGFIHRKIMVLPRQTCGLYTHTVFIDKFPGGRQVLEKSIHGGELFQTIVYNPISIFMTHLSNYGNDRLAIYTFESVIKFLKCWTNLNLMTVPPLQLGEKYFHMFPDEEEPIWGNPCLDRRHRDIWATSKMCEQLPKFLVIGPQKTGTTALYTFLSMHPAISSNYPSPETFEEVQFFNGRNYAKGIDWYMKFFPLSQNSSSKYLFEKSATYFDGELVPRRVKGLLPSSRLVTIIIPPSKRAYSWYHHMRAHNDITALNYSFNDVITATDKAPRPLRDLRNKCLNPGMYAKHIERWLDYFPSTQLSIIDGESLRNNPVDVMNRLQRFLKIRPFFNYTEHLRFDKKKGFFCQVTEEDKTKCLGRGKGRQYPPMTEVEEKLLRDYYQPHNVVLEKLLTRLNYPVPVWLLEDLASS
ncbi:N-deacetylase and N-sulfotransferase sfl [Oratosquilla oratoria]|uniref:N-deacetylase and N-sulfotransferase sfl n=1 Tax=Oratosquilla oratoria TaxID=337810 RepID=UPI003F7661AA